MLVVGMYVSPNTIIRLLDEISTILKQHRIVEAEHAVVDSIIDDCKNEGDKGGLSGVV